MVLDPWQGRSVMAQRRALVTGCAGFIGSAVARALLDRGDEVVGLDNFDPFYARSLKEENLQSLRTYAGFSFSEVDVCSHQAIDELFALHRPRTVYHLAALAGVRPSLREPARYAAVNVEGTVNLLEAARRIEGLRFILASSSSVYGNSCTAPFSEDDRVDSPISPYAATKRAAELIAHTYSSVYGMPIACLRFFTVYGPAQRPDLAIMKFMRLIARGEDIPRFGSASTSRDYTYIDDIVRGVLASAERIGQDDIGQFRIWNLGNSSPVQLGDLIDMIAQVVGKPARVSSQPMQPGDVDQTWADLSRSERDLGYQPVMPFRDGLERQWNWLKPRLS